MNAFSGRVERCCLPIGRIIFSGLCFGAAWSLIPGRLSEILLPVGQGLTVIVAGMLTGLAVSFLLSIPLLKTGSGTAILLGIVSLPLGAFVFGIVVSLVQLLVLYATGHAYRFVGLRFSPLSIGIQYALGTFIPYFAAFLFPLAISSTCYLQHVLKSAASARKEFGIEKGQKRCQRTEELSGTDA